MARYILAFGIESNFYREYHEEGHSDEELLKELKGDIEDQVAKYDLPQLVKRMLSFERNLEIPIVVDRVEQPVMRYEFQQDRNLQTRTV